MLNIIMAKSTNFVKRKAGRPATLGATEFVGLRLPAALLRRIENWARGEKIAGRSEAVRGLIEKSILVLLPHRRSPSDGELERAIEYAQRLLDASIAVVGTSRIQLNERWARDPKVVALTLLCRSISNFRAAVRLVQQEQVMEARTLVRLLYENLLWLGALRERGFPFVQDMIADDMHNRKALAELTMKITGKHGADVSDGGALKLRSFINELGLQSTKKLRADKIAAEGPVEPLYVEYTRLSLDAAHCSVTALGRHLSSERTATKTELMVSVIPKTPPKEVLSTVVHACRALMGAAIGANELVGFTSVSDKLSTLVAEFEKNGWVRID